jgi:uncharacterized protein YkwD
MHTGSMIRLRTLVSATALVGGLALQTVSAQGDPLVAALSQARQRGCGAPGSRTPLRAVPELGRAARSISSGVAPVEALRQAGYRYTRLHQVNMSGPRSAAAAAGVVAQRYCPQLMDPQLTDVGVYQQGTSYWVVLAAPFTPPAASAAGEVATRVLQLVNEARGRPRQCGNRSFQAAGPLQRNGLLDQAAAVHARDMAGHSYMAHEGHDGSSFDARISGTGYRWRSVAENVAAGQPTADEVVRDWIKSPGHCANLMNPVFTEMGVAFATNPRSTDGIYWAQTFGRPR